MLMRASESVGVRALITDARRLLSFIYLEFEHILYTKSKRFLKQKDSVPFKLI